MQEADEMIGLLEYKRQHANMMHKGKFCFLCATLRMKMQYERVSKHIASNSGVTLGTCQLCSLRKQSF